MQNDWFTARELAGLPGMPGTVFRTREKLGKLSIPSRPRAGRAGGGGLEFDAAHLPDETQAALLARRVEQQGSRAVAVLAAPATPTPATVESSQLMPAQPAQPASPERQPPSDSERRCADARLQLLWMASDLVAEVGSITRAYGQLAAQATLAAAGSELHALLQAANQRSRGALSGRTLQNWARLHREGGWAALLPAPVAVQPLPTVGEDVTLVLGRYFSRDAQFRNLTDAVRQVVRELGLNPDGARALYSRCRRALAKTDNVAAIKSRHSGTARAALLPLKRRDTSVLAPNDVWLMDGHTFKAKVRHPDHGQPFAPELTIAMDARTRRIMGWSVSLSENVMAVGDALRHGIACNGVPAILYTDNGAGETARAMDCPIDGFCARLGIEHRTGIPGHPQGHGLIERSWRTHAIRAARQFGSFQGSDVDPGEYRRAASRIAKEQRAIARATAGGNVIALDTKLLPSWAQFVQAMDAMVADYNATHRHRSLPKNAAGQHMTPDEAWAAWVQPQDVHRLTELELRALFRPSVLRTARRGEVQFFNQVYAAPELMRRDVDRQQVSVRYDIHDPSTVEVYTLAGDFVCQARWGANLQDYYARPVVEMAKERRARAAIKRREQQIDTALRELSGSTVPALELSGDGVCLPGLHSLTGAAHEGPSPALRAVTNVSTTHVLDATAEIVSGRPFFSSSGDRYEWLMANRTRRDECWTDADGPWLEQYVASDAYAQLADYYASRGLAWVPPDEGGDGFRGAQAAGAAAA